ncbi:lipoprotein intramolecular transacylase Lit, partial [Intestinibacter sp.]
SNDYWIFDPQLDPVINMLPEEFFMHMGITILIMMLIVSIILQLIYKLIKKINFQD